MGMRVVVTGATGNVGTSVVAALGREPKVEDDPETAGPARLGELRSGIGARR